MVNITFEQYWDKYGQKFEVKSLEFAFKEAALQAWDARGQQRTDFFLKADVHKELETT